MSEQNWTYTYNTFEVATRNSAKKMSILGPDHKSKLEAESSDPDIAALNTATQAPINAYATAYAHWIAINGAYKGETNRFTSLLADLRSQTIKQWDAQIQVVHLEGTSDYVAILPHGRKPFQSGAYDVRLAEVAALAERLLSYAPLAALQTAVAAYYSTLLDARDVQQQKEGLVKQASEALNTSRIALAQQMYKNLGALMAKYYLNPLEIERFYDLALIRSHNNPGDIDLPEPTANTVGANEIKNALTNTFTDSSLITITNTGTVPLLFYLGNSPSANVMPPTVGISIDAGVTSTYAAIEFGATFTPFLNVKNTSPSVIGSYEIMVE